MRSVIILAIMLIFTTASLVTAQTSRYSTWSNPNASTPTNGAVDLPAFVEELNKLIDEAEKANAADPVFLRDLRSLANSANHPWQSLVLSDDFTDGDFTQNPAWTVLSGEYFIETGWGLRNRLAKTAQSAQSTQQQDVRGEDIAKALFGQVLNQALRGGQTQQSAQPVAASTENIIASAASLSNAFAIEAEISSWIADGHFELGVYQGTDAKNGYRVVYRSGQPIQLLRVGSRGSSVVETAGTPLSIEDKAFHVIEWTRGVDGAMRVVVDGTTLIETTDRGFSDPFDGVRISNQSGDFIIRRISATGL